MIYVFTIKMPYKKGVSEGERVERVGHREGKRRKRGVNERGKRERGKFDKWCI